MALIITFEGREYTLDKEKIDVDEWRELKRKYGMTPKQFDVGIGEADPDASTFLYWIMLRRAGDHRTPLGDQLKPDIIALNAAIAEAVDTTTEEERKAAEPDPTTSVTRPDGPTLSSGASGTETSASSGTPTSSSSPATADSEPPK